MDVPVGWVVVLAVLLVAGLVALAVLLRRTSSHRGAGVRPAEADAEADAEPMAGGGS